MKRFLIAAVVVGMFTAGVSAPADAQRVPETPVQRAAFVLGVKKQVEKDAIAHPKNRVLVQFRDGTKAVGRIREAREGDFVLAQGGKKPDRTIAYADVIHAPNVVAPLGERIAEYTVLGIVFVICFPFILLMILTGQGD
jgi:hypothetical protein